MQLDIEVSPPAFVRILSKDRYHFKGNTTVESSFKVVHCLFWPFGQDIDLWSSDFWSSLIFGLVTDRQTESDA